MVWDTIGYTFQSSLVRIYGTLNSACYISGQLRPMALPFIRALRNYTFQQDNARAHVADIERTFLDTHGKQMFEMFLELRGRNESFQSLRHIGLLYGRWRHHLSPPSQFRHGTGGERDILQPPALVVSAATVDKFFGHTDLTCTYSVCTRTVFGSIGHQTQAFRSGVRCSNLQASHGLHR
ncbi:transposable element Tcb1 transposase [Trichonephila clavipes]|nr:transposable element Tcb1 transposase [Trichonephila clavipes]